MKKLRKSIRFELERARELVHVTNYLIHDSWTKMSEGLDLPEPAFSNARLKAQALKLVELEAQRKGQLKLCRVLERLLES